MNIQAVIFDVDGTLVDSVDLHARAWQEAFAEFGKEVGFTDVRAQIGKGGDQLLPVFLSPGEIDEFGKALEEWRGEHFKSRYLPEVRAFPKTRELFQRVLADGRNVALASSAKEAELKIYEEIAQIGDLVRAETSANDAKKSKPHPDIFQAALGRLGEMDPAQVIVVGDTPWDAIAAAKAGMRAVGVRCGGFAEEDLRAAGCIAIFADPADLLARHDEFPLAG